MDHSTYIFGVRYPNRIFVGGLPRETTATKLANFFNKFGQVTESKVILNEDGTSKGYGFITFSTSDDVKAVFGQGTIFYNGKKLNLGPAIRKQAPETPGERVVVFNSPSPSPVLPPSPPPMQQTMQPTIQMPPLMENTQSHYISAYPYMSYPQYQPWPQQIC